jgi:hypothetical protein
MNNEQQKPRRGDMIVTKNRENETNPEGVT